MWPCASKLTLGILNAPPFSNVLALPPSLTVPEEIELLWLNVICPADFARVIPVPPIKSMVLAVPPSNT